MRFGLFYQLPASQEQSEVARYRETVEQVVYADELGFDAAWFAESHFYREFSTVSTPLIVAASLAGQTKRIRLGTGVSILPLHHPVRIAEEGATVDVLSNGRLDLGVGRGTFPFHFQGFGVPQIESEERFEETLEFIDKAWTRKNVSFTGKHYRIPAYELVPAPVQQPRPPIWVAANSSKRAEFAGRKGYSISIATPSNPLPTRFYEQIDIYRRALRDVDHESEEGKVAAVLFVYVGESRAQVRDEVEQSLLHYFSNIGANLPYEYAEEALSIYGSPEECVAKITEVGRIAKLDQLICWFNPGGLVPHERVMRAMRLFAEEVMPACRALVRSSEEHLTQGSTATLAI